MSCDTEYLRKQLSIFSETWSPSFQQNCVQLFWWFSHKPSEKHWAISPKAKHKISKKTLSSFQKCLFERCSAFLFGFNWKIVLRTSSDLSTWNNTCFLFKCRVKFRLLLFLKATFGIFALYILRLRCLGISNTYKKTALVSWAKQKHSKTTLSTFQKGFSWALLSSAGLDSLVVNKKAVLRTSSDLSTWKNTCFLLFKCTVKFWLR